MGWAVGRSKSGKTIYEHGGGSVGGTSQLVLYPDTHVVVAFVCNFASDDNPIKKTARQMYHMRDAINLMMPSVTDKSVGGVLATIFVVLGVEKAIFVLFL
jgi:hypothetical protein